MVDLGEVIGRFMAASLLVSVIATGAVTASR